MLLRQLLRRLKEKKNLNSLSGQSAREAEVGCALVTLSVGCMGVLPRLQASEHALHRKQIRLNVQQLPAAALV